jgi:hypothetical protein
MASFSYIRARALFLLWIAPLPPAVPKPLTRVEARRVAADTDVANNETRAPQPLWH